jgi:hypothetical protein
MASNIPLITTIIPTYPRPERLKKAIESVLSQTYSNFQICIYDNASGDATFDVVSKLCKVDSRIHYHCHSENIGATENFQYGLSRVNTPYFSFLSDDDFLLPEFYETTLKGFEKYPEAGISSGIVLDLDERRNLIDAVLLSWPDQEFYLPPQGLMQMIGKYSNWAGTLFCTEKVKSIGLLDPSLKAIDVDYLFRISAQLPMVISKKLCAAFVHHASSYSSLQPFKLIVPGWDHISAKLMGLGALSEEHKTTIQCAMHADLQRILFSIGVKMIEHKNFKGVNEVIRVFDPQQQIKRKLLQVLSRGAQSSRCIVGLIQMLLNLRRKRKVHRCVLAFKRGGILPCSELIDIK